MSIELLNCDCMEYMRGLENNAFDLAFTSPPYNMNLRVNSKGDGYCSRQIVKELSTKYASFPDNLPMEDYYKFLVNVIGELIRVSNIVFFNIQMITGNKPALFKALGYFSDQIKELIVWDKCRAQPAIGNGVLNSTYELIIVLGGTPINRAFDSPKFPRGTLDNILRIPAGKSNFKGHSAAFPLALSDAIFSNFTSKGQRVFDPFLGTGTTAISAFAHSLNFVGCELDKDYFEAAQKRFNNETSQGALF